MLNFKDVLEISVTGLVVYLFIKKMRLPVRFKASAEIRAVGEVAEWALEQIGPADPRWRDLVYLRAYLIGAVPKLGSSRIPFMTRLSGQQLALAAPFINQCIDREGVLSQPATECDKESNSSAIRADSWTGGTADADRPQERSALLSGFKARMVTEGKWPPADA